MLEAEQLEFKIQGSGSRVYECWRRSSLSSRFRVQGLGFMSVGGGASSSFGGRNKP